MFKFEHYFLINGDWENDGYDVRDRLPEKDDIFYLKEKAYTVVDIKEIEDDYLVFEVYLD